MIVECLTECAVHWKPRQLTSHKYVPSSISASGDNDDGRQLPNDPKYGTTEQLPDHYNNDEMLIPNRHGRSHDSIMETIKSARAFPTELISNTLVCQKTMMIMIMIIVMIMMMIIDHSHDHDDHDDHVVYQDHDAKSLGQTVASSSNGEDRQKM
jgi:hypothetical protein